MTSAENDGVWSSPLHRGLVEQLIRMRRRKAELHRDSVLDASAFSILWLLSDGQGRTLREITEALDLEQSTVNRQVNATIKRGFVERYEVADQVSWLHRPTDAGRAAFENDAQHRVQRLERVFADLAPGSPQELLIQLRAFNDAYERSVANESLD